MAKQKTYYVINKGEVSPIRSRKEPDVLSEELKQTVYEGRIEAELKASGLKLKAEAAPKKLRDLKWVVTDTVITIHYKKERRQIKRSETSYNSLLNAIKTGDAAALKDIFDTKKKVESTGLKAEKGTLTHGGVAIPTKLAETFVDMCNDPKIGMTAAKAFFKRVALNPKRGILKELVNFLQHNHMLFTTEGKFIGYKGVGQDLKDIRSKTFLNEPGATLHMPREDVVDDPSITCASGLHVGSWKYARSFGARVVEVLVDPIDVVSVPTDYNGQKMRCCKYKVLNVITAPRFHNSCVIKL